MPRPGTQTAQSATVATSSGEVTIRYLLSLPRDYGKPGESWPLLLFLHGAGERGEDLELVKLHGPPKKIDGGEDLPFVVVSPQCEPGGDWQNAWQAEPLMQLVDHVAGQYAVDPQRLYVTGLSMGGYGVWRLLVAYDDRFAAAVPICGGGDSEAASNIAPQNVWAFHGAKDEVIPFIRSQEMVQAIWQSGGQFRLTVYPHAAHDSWTETYDNEEVYQWLLSHRRGE